MKILALCWLILYGSSAFAQRDSLPVLSKKVSARFIEQIKTKAAHYSHRISTRTAKALTKLARWEGKIKALLEKASPETAQRLFGEGQVSFALLLEQYKKGQSVAKRYGSVYDEYRDRLKGTMGYLASPQPSPKGEGAAKNVAEGAASAYRQLQQLDSLIGNTEAMEQFIKERKRQLIEQCVQYIGKSKWLQKIDKESYYYIETLRNYKAIFSDSKKAGELAMKLLKKVPGFEPFLQRNSAVAGLFGFNTNVGSGNVPNLAGLQTRAGTQSLLQQRFGSGAAASLQGNVQNAQSQLAQLKDRFAQAGNRGNDELPSFKPNQQKTKTFWQRIEYTANVGFGKLNPMGAVTARRDSGGAIGTADLALGIGYKLNDKSTVGLGVGYKLGLGNWQRIRLSGQGMSLRSYIDWRLKKQFYISGGYEMNWIAASPLTPLRPERGTSPQRSGLIGLSKKIKIKHKWIKGSSVQLLYNLLYRQQRPEGQPFVFRIGYSFK